MSYEYTEEANRIVVKDAEGNEAGEITFTRSGENIIIIDHTGVNDDHRGQGLAQKLVAKTVELAERENLKVMPLCPFAKKEFDEKQEYQAFLYQ